MRSKEFIAWGKYPIHLSTSRTIHQSFSRSDFAVSVKREISTAPHIVLLGPVAASLLQVLFGDEASFPPWGTLSYTWARRGHQPMVKTSGKRKGDKVFGVIEYFTGRFWYQGQEGRLNSEAYITFLTRVMEQTTPPIMLIQDGARYHTSAALQRFFARHTERLTVFQLPSYSPDYNPIEKLRKVFRSQDGMHGRGVPDSM
jgi:DDE superfamily endonuclease